MMKQKKLFLINSKANEGDAMKRWRVIAKKYKTLSENPVDMTTIADLSGFIKNDNPDLVVIIGGDGAINRVCQAVSPLSKKPLLAIIPLGFGNALSKCFGVETVEKAVSVLEKQPGKVLIDLFKTTIPEKPIGVFSMGVGFDAQIVHTRMYHRYIGMRSYILAAIQSSIMHTMHKLTITIDHKITLSSTATALIIANSPTIGRNFILSEDAKLDDGFLDCTLFSSHYAYFTNLRLRGFKHPLYSDENKVHFRAKHITISGEQFAQVDGDPAIHIKPIEIEILPKAVTFLRNDIEKIELEQMPFTYE
ncbi:MAG TPA: diacylglycerol kinase family protein [Patescibacteria group bacterium]|nr:diacylglycerol kinase family protein [Patescibacteria group bacterium]